MDIRLPCDVWSAPWALDMEGRYGAAGVLGVLKLWTWHARHAPTGRARMPHHAMAGLMGLGGARGVLRAMVRNRLVRLLPDGWELPGWTDAQPWVARRLARAGASCSGHAASMRSACGEHVAGVGDGQTD